MLSTLRQQGHGYLHRCGQHATIDTSFLNAAPLLRRSYTQLLPTAEDYTKEPPPAPAHLQLTLLNVPPAMDATASLPRPQHVVLNHTYCQRASPQVVAQLQAPTTLHALCSTQQSEVQCLSQLQRVQVAQECGCTFSMCGR